VGGHGSFGSVSSSLMGVTLGYPSGHPDPHSSIMASVVESQNTVSSVATDTTTTGLLARQPPIGIETAAATNPTRVISDGNNAVQCRTVAVDNQTYEDIGSSAP